MFIGHLPAGYVLTKSIQKKLEINKYLKIGLVASVLPDVDMFYFYFIDEKQHLHHGYWTHTPFYWGVIAIFVFSFVWVLKKKDYYFPVMIFFLNIFLHLMLDTIVGKIGWLFPLKDKAYFLFNVPNKYDFWVYNFVLHWTFLFEIGFVGLALYLYLRNK